MEWLNSLLRHFKIQTLLKINCCMAAISAFRVTQHSQIFSLFFRNRIKCIALYQLHSSQALLNLRLLRHFKIQTLLKINCCMAAISAFRVTQHSQIFSLFFRNRIKCIALYQLHNSQALLNLRLLYTSKLGILQ